MEKQLKLKRKILNILPKVAAAVSFINPPFSPSRYHKSKPDNTRHKGFSAPITSMIPHQNRKKPNHDDIDYQEPTSPKISCMGQIKHEKKRRMKKTKIKDIEVKKNVSTFKKMLFYATKSKSGSSDKLDNEDVVVKRVTNMSQMKRFASGRDTFANFDWKDQMVAEEIDCCYKSDDFFEEEKEIIIPFSAPILLSDSSCRYGDGGVIHLKPRKEINLWKRRTMAKPKPLQFE
ncbi:hypothetical protein TanjilG_09728 [Lupinus angustifolius]|uniref:Syringolide-induced protein 14-1-1 n=1 Tax=Lupinus angustifolius TaxID=3871 RepID=A0A4P1QW65_LUPAN|nr:PREDICTED: uncharacterized protein At1g76070-like [Lupinus angustifolius]OIV96301.1 hypothetical protein TanjilG_09728 [Lupinus angustifolius]